ncbi:MAG: HK97 gp10 family phage protein [Xanthomonadaceae bacterium]|nr:HK97 gp10 family phage protein [Xanthomonadaceae bacterium]
MADEFELQGLDRAIDLLKALPNNARKKVVMMAARKATRVITNAAKANSAGIDDPSTGRKIALNIQQRFASKTYRATGDVMFRVGVATPKGPIPKGNADEGAKGPTGHWHLLELGTEDMKAEPFMLPALTANVGNATDTFANEFQQGLKDL